MRNFIIGGVFVAILFVIWSLTQQNNQGNNIITKTDKRILRVTGKGTLKIEQDEIGFRSNVTDLEINTDKVKNITAKIKQKLENNSAVEDIEISFRNQKVWDSKQKKYTDTNFIASINFLVDEKNATTIQDMLLKNGAKIDSTWFDVSEDSRRQAETNAITKATQNGREQVEAILGKNAKYTIAEIQIQPQNHSYPVLYGGAYAKSEAMASPDTDLVSSGTREISTTVSMVIHY